MLANLFAKIVAGVSEELLVDLFKAIIREIIINQKTERMSRAISRLEEVLEELKAEPGISDDEKNARLIDAGRAIVRGLRS